MAGPAEHPAPRPWTITAGALVVSVRLTPKGGRDAIEGIERLADGTAVLKVRVRAAPMEGEANDALIRLMAKSLRIAPRHVSLAGGATSRVKRIRIEGDPASLSAQLDRITGGNEP